MIKAVGAAEGEILRVESTLLTKGSFVKIQPCSLDFLDITDPKAVQVAIIWRLGAVFTALASHSLENALRHFSALTQGDTIAIHYNDRQYDLLLLETHPGSEAISIHETDLEVMACGDGKLGARSCLSGCAGRLCSAARLRRACVYEAAKEHCKRAPVLSCVVLHANRVILPVLV